MAAQASDADEKKQAPASNIDSAEAFLKDMRRRGDALYRDAADILEASPTLLDIMFLLGGNRGSDAFYANGVDNCHGHFVNIRKLLQKRLEREDISPSEALKVLDDYLLYSQTLRAGSDVKTEALLKDHKADVEVEKKRQLEVRQNFAQLDHKSADSTSDSAPTAPSDPGNGKGKKGIFGKGKKDKKGKDDKDAVDPKITWWVD